MLVLVLVLVLVLCCAVLCCAALRCAVLARATGAGVLLAVLKENKKRLEEETDPRRGSATAPNKSALRDTVGTAHLPVMV